MRYLLLFFTVVVAACNPEIESDPDILVKEGFIVQKLFNPTAKGMGSWVSLTKETLGKVYHDACPAQ